ncbi:MAG: helix-turn-helix domain-containing protein [Devosia sp.]
MNIKNESEALAALGHPGRLAVFRLLARRMPQGVRPSEIAGALRLKPNTLSVYAGILTRAGLLNTWRDGRSVYYGVNLDRFGELVRYLVHDCCHGRPELCLDDSGDEEVTVAGRSGPYHVLFVCTGNSARSIFAEALLGRMGHGQFVAHSAGTKPYSRVNPKAALVLQSVGDDPGKYSPKSANKYLDDGSARMDFVVTVCDRAANEDAPPWPGRPMIAHWGVSDPVSAGNDNQLKPFEIAFRALEHKVKRFAKLPLDTMRPTEIQAALDDIGQNRDKRGPAPRGARNHQV